ncbi:cytoplasmic protein [Methyloversatilis discipulorum]|uniref:cytoplasmic protein n=1 Tax=Methyloversatilis discipulorum TaxID=1119528 RepID=UPI0031381B54
MNTYRLIIHNRDQLLGHFESSTPSARKAVTEIADCLKRSGYQLELLVAYDEKRLVESTSQGVRLLSSEPLFKPASFNI